MQALPHLCRRRSQHLNEAFACPERPALGIRVKYGGEQARRMARAGHVGDMIDKKMSQTMAAPVGGDQQQADEGIVPLRKAEGQVSDGIKPAAAEQTQLQGIGGSSDKRCRREEVGHMCIGRNLAGFQIDVIGGAVEQVANGGGIGIGVKFADQGHGASP